MSNIDDFIQKIGLDHWSTFLVSSIAIVASAYRVFTTLKKRYQPRIRRVETQQKVLMDRIHMILHNQIIIANALESIRKVPLEGLKFPDEVFDE